MKKSKHFRKDVITARIIAGVLLILLLVLLVWGISSLVKSSGDNKDTQNSQNTEHVQNERPEFEDTEDTQEDWVEPEDTEPEDTEDVVQGPEVEMWIVTTANLNLRAEPNTSCEKLEQIPEGTKLGVIEELDGWYKVRYYGKDGYVSKTYVELSEEE